MIVRLSLTFTLWFSLFVLILPVSARAQGSPAGSRALPAQIEALIAQVAREHGHMVPRPDPGLAAAAADLVRLSNDEKLPSGSDIITDALNLHGVVPPAPHLILTTSGVGSAGEARLLSELRERLPEVLGHGSFRLVGVAVVPVPPDKQRVLIMLLESYVELDAVPRQVPIVSGKSARSSDVPVTLSAVVLPPFNQPEVLVTDPAGQVAKVAIATQPVPVPIKDRGAPGSTRIDDKASRISGTVHCLAKGRYQIEIAADDRSGSTVLANFPLYCGVPAPTQLVAAAAPAERPFKDAADAEAQLLALLQADRDRLGLPRLTLNPQLAAVARAHSQDMSDHDFLGHISKTTGDAGDRVRKAGLSAPMVLENLARANTPLEAERGLLDSPGHRANLLSKDVTEVGIGVHIRQQPGAPREIFVTQLFRRPQEEFDPRKMPLQALERVQQLRDAAQVNRLRVDPTLAELAQSTANALSSGKLAEQQVGQPAEAALPKMDRRYRRLHTVLAITTDVKSLTASAALVDPKVQVLGLGVMPASADEKRKLSGAMYVVLVLAELNPPKEAAREETPLN